MRTTLVLFSLAIFTSLGTDVVAVVTEAPQWQEVEFDFNSEAEYTNPYTDAEGWVVFSHERGQEITRPMFWDGGNKFRVRFASPMATGNWKWISYSTTRDRGLAGRSGTLRATPSSPPKATVFSKHGFWTIPDGERHLVHADGTPRLLCADTPWALPWRATIEQARVYAIDRQKKGFNAALLMTVQPDRSTVGPRSRTEVGGFEVGFEDLPDGKLRKLNVDYFQYFDSLIDELTSRGIAPVYQPVFHGYGWKGGGAAGNVIGPKDYRRYCRYLVARYGARPAIWLIGGDGPATDSAIMEQLDQAGREIEKWDAYGQPIGIHYSPHALNRTHQDKGWLDFQWCQTGHNAEHVPERVADMARNTPTKAIANGEPTYENIGQIGKAEGWWQGEEAWLNLTAGGGMGVVYGAASLWNWRLSPDEPGHAEWCTAPNAGWREALDFHGSNYPGIVAKIFDGLPFRGMQPDWTSTYGRRGLSVPGKLFVLYLPNGGSTPIVSAKVPLDYRIINPKTGVTVTKARLPESGRRSIDCHTTEPCVVVFTNPQFN